MKQKLLKVTPKLQQQVNLLLASLAGMPVNKGVEYLLNHPLKEKFITLLFTTRYGFPELLMHVGSYENNMISVSLDADDFQGLSYSAYLEIRRSEGMFYSLGLGYVRLSKKDTETLRFIEALDKLVGLFKTQIGKNVTNKELARMKTSVEFIDGIKNNVT